MLLVISFAHHSSARGDAMQAYVKSIVGDSLAETNDCTDTPYPLTPTQGDFQKVKPVDNVNNTIFSDDSCLAPVQKIYAQWEEGGALIVDVRKPAQYQQHQISGSINLSIHEIKYKQSLKKRNLVLMNKGLTQRFLLNECIRLKQQGFNQVSVLEGGLNAWNDQGFPLISRAGSFVTIDEITPYEYLNASPETEWIYIDLDHSSTEIRSLVSNAKILNYNGDISEFKTDFQKFKGSEVSGQTIRYLAVDKNGRNYLKYKQLFSDLAIKDVFFLSGGVTGLLRRKQQQVALLERQQKGFQVRMGCN
jgi:rhodanese-related sulfurtransferase